MIQLLEGNAWIKYSKGWYCLNCGKIVDEIPPEPCSCGGKQAQPTLHERVERIEGVLGVK